MNIERNTVLRAIACAGLMSFTIGAPTAVAVPLVFELNCVKTGNDACAPGDSTGTLTLTGITGGDIQVDLFSSIFDQDGGNVVKEVLLNLDPSLESSVSLTANIAGSSNNINAETLSPWSAAFDFLSSGSLKPDPITGSTATFNISAVSSGSNFDLTPEMFAFANAVGSPTLYAAVHWQTCGDDPICPGGSLKVGASNPPGDKDPKPPGVPVPGTLALFGLGLTSLAWYRRKKI